VLYRRIEDKGEEIFHLVLPECFHKQALKIVTSLLVSSERLVYWPGITKDVYVYLKSCDRCIKRKSSTDVQVLIVSIITSQPPELVTMDILTLEAHKGGFEHLLVITDHFTKYAMAISTRNQTAR